MSDYSGICCRLSSKDRQDLIQWGRKLDGPSTAWNSNHHKDPIDSISGENLVDTSSFWPSILFMFEVTLIEQVVTSIASVLNP